MQICVKGNKRQLLEHNFTKKCHLVKTALANQKFAWRTIVTKNSRTNNKKVSLQ